MRLAVISVLLSTISIAPNVAPALADEIQLVPVNVSLRDDVAESLAASWLDDEARSDLRVRHGVWKDQDLAAPERRAEAMLLSGAWTDEVFRDEGLSVETRAEALILRGRCTDAIEMLESIDSNSARVLRIRAFEACGLWEGALDEIDLVLSMDAEEQTGNQEIIDRVVARSVRARILGTPSSEYRSMMSELGRAREEVDRLDWRPRLMEARLLVEKHNRSEAVSALHETLSLNPRCAEAWFLLGRIALGGFDFDSASRASTALRRLSDRSPLADLLDAESALINDDPDRSIAILEPLLDEEPRLREALALRAAADAVAYDIDSARARLDVMDSDCPDCADGYHTVGRFLSQNRQYPDAATFLEEAVSRRPSWSAPLIELGLLEMQSGRDDRALEVLRRVADLDRFNERAAFSLRLLEELSAFETIETEHFIIRYLPGEDEVLVKMMPDALEAMHREVVGRFNHQPDLKTVIEVMPDHEFFSVRITGMPWIHTVAACTGPVIAMEVPRKGPPSLHLGLFDWLDTLRHEYTHTITLDRTRNRIPHWLTEAASVTMEHAPRDYATARMLAMELETDGLFDMTEIDWAFIRPKRPIDRQLAYAQGAWMVEYMDETHGPDALTDLLDHYFEGLPQSEAMLKVLGVSEDRFHAGFLEWAEARAMEWGFFATPTINELIADVVESAPRDGTDDSVVEQDLRQSAFVPDDVQVEKWIEMHPTHPDLLELIVRRRIDRDSRSDPETLRYLKRYRDARPVDPYPDQVLARLYLDSEDRHLAVEPLTRLEALNSTDPLYAHQLTQLHRELGSSEDARESASMMLRIDPYRPEFHELAAAVSIETGRLDQARVHLEALIILEPGQGRHSRRLAALDRIISKRNSKPDGGISNDSSTMR